MQQGELIITGKSRISIPLHGFPSEVRAHFKDELELNPCNPHHFDELEYEVQASNTVRGGFILLITWNVSSVREIKWHVAY